jgi:hypothetical protein
MTHIPRPTPSSCYWSVALTCSLILLSGCTGKPDAEVLTAIPWALISRPLVMDTHTHTRFSDGKYPVDELVQLAVNEGCDALAITDHSDLGEDAATPEYFAAIRAARAAYPDLILFGGIEWNIPPYGGREHVTVLLNPDIEETVLGPLKQQFEQENASADQALDWLADEVGSVNNAALIYNHPSRKDDDPKENLRDMLGWLDTNKLFIGFEGAPGHQNARQTGSYTHEILPQDRWDPVAAAIGGSWDQLLDKGYNIHAAIATSDYHNENLDHAPCGFSRIHIYPDDRTPRGILAGLRAGSFWSDHGKILDDLLFTLSAPGLPLPVTPGEVAGLRSGQPQTFTVILQRGSGAMNSSLVVELIGNGRSGKPELLHSKQLLADEYRVDWVLDDAVAGADGRSVYLRLRVRKSVEDGPDLMAYTNAIRVVTR